ncbi:unnamed protein product [Protopolystoma xenopodis]|uniref:Uncharacterized protein n=1 Tax=Protopolystoma xenopodis TaxID=117903 RepID=A0A448X0A7_9PLAT|nr:unnamed protein product [Protopolystoma xenopodis]
MTRALFAFNTQGLRHQCLRLRSSRQRSIGLPRAVSSTEQSANEINFFWRKAFAEIDDASNFDEISSHSTSSNDVYPDDGSREIELTISDKDAPLSKWRFMNSSKELGLNSQSHGLWDNNTHQKTHSSVPKATRPRIQDIDRELSKYRF